MWQSSGCHRYLPTINEYDLTSIIFTEMLEIIINVKEILFKLRNWFKTRTALIKSHVKASIADQVMCVRNEDMTSLCLILSMY